MAQQLLSYSNEEGLGFQFSIDGETQSKLKKAKLPMKLKQVSQWWKYHLKFVRVIRLFLI